MSDRQVNMLVKEAPVAVLKSSASVAAPGSRVAAGSATPRPNWWLRAGVVAVFLAHLPLLYAHVGILLSKPHNQFLLVLPVAVAWLGWTRWREIPGKRSGNPAGGLIIGAGAATLLSIATYLWSPWLASVAAMFSLLAILVGVGGGTVTRMLLPVWWLCWFFVSLPFNMDEDLTQYLRQMATTATSSLLDQFEVLHLVEGNVLEVPGHAFFVDDACSGIHSLFVILAAAVMLGLWRRRTVLQLLALLLCAAFLVMIENLTRLVGVVLGDHIGLDLSEGAPHTAFGLVVFVITLFLLWSADQLISFLIPEVIFARRARRRAEASALNPDTSAPSPSPALGTAPKASFVGLAAAFVAIGGWQVARMPSTPAPPAAVSLIHAFDELASLQLKDLPAEIEGFQRQQIRFEERSPEDPKGSYSQIWVYTGHGLQAQLSVDYAYETVRDLCICYELTGWTVQEQRLIGEGEDALVEAQLTKPFRGNANLCYSFINRAGESGTRLFSREEITPLRRYWNRLLSFVGKEDADAAQQSEVKLSGPVAQIQVFAAGATDLTPPQRESLIRFYVAARKDLTRACMAKLKGSP